MRVQRRKVLLWGLPLSLAALGGGAWFAYSYVTDSATLAAILRAQTPRYLPEMRLAVGHVRVRPFRGEVSLTHLEVYQRLSGLEFLVFRAPRLQVRADAAALVRGRFVPGEVIAIQPLVRLCRRRDGTWNVQGMLADPWPAPAMKAWPVVRIEKGTFELVERDSAVVRVLRDVALRVTPTADGPLRFEGTAQGELFETIRLEGTIDPSSGQLELNGQVNRLGIAGFRRQPLPAELRPLAAKLRLTAGELDLTVDRLSYNTRTRAAPQFAGSARLRAGVVQCPELPFPLNDLSAVVNLTDRSAVLERAEGFNGKTTVRARGTFTLDDPANGPFDVTAEVTDLELDQRLRSWRAEQFGALWDQFQPHGRINLAVRAIRRGPRAPVGFGLGVDCFDVALRYKGFPYPLDHVFGKLKWEGRRLTVDLHSALGTAKGWIDDPGDDAHVRLEFASEALPVDRTLFDAMPRDVYAIVAQFQPTGTVRARATMERRPPDPAHPTGEVTIRAVLDLGEHCSMTWAGMPYPVSNLTGQLRIEPDSWTFRDVKGSNGQAIIEGSGRVERIARDAYRGDIHLTARNLPFDQQLHDALPLAWQKTWTRLNPVGSSRVDARIRFDPKSQDYRVTIVPEAGARLGLVVSRPAGPGRTIPVVFPMDDIKGTFESHNELVTMKDVRFQFLGSPVWFGSGSVVVRDSGQFRLGVRDLSVSDFRVDHRLRKLMPPVMAQFALRLDDGRTLAFRARELNLGWSGRDDESAWCTWGGGLVVFNGNTIQTGLPLEHLQGQLEQVGGRFVADHLTGSGVLNLDSVSLLGQQITDLRGRLEVREGDARLTGLHGALLGGEIGGGVEISLDATPKYAAEVTVRDADLQQYAKTRFGRQTFRGLVSGQIGISGLGNDLHQLQGGGWARIAEGDLGELPVYLRLLKVLNRSPATRTAFDSAYVEFKIHNGRSYLRPIQLTGNALSLRGAGTMDPQGELDLKFSILFGRDRWHVPGFSDAFREASGQIFRIHVTGTPAYPKFRADPLHPATTVLKRTLGSRRTHRETQAE